MIKTNIEWCDSTFNPWIGCTMVSPGCANCYAAAQDKLRHWTSGGWGKGKPRHRTTPAYWRQADKWNREYLELNATIQLSAHRPRVFPSLCDWLDDEVPIEWLADFLKAIHDTPALDWLLLTKRPENWRNLMIKVRNRWCVGEDPNHDLCVWLDGWLSWDPPANIWIGTSVENKAMAKRRIPLLMIIPAKIRFLSVEPLLEKVDVLDVMCRANNVDCRLPGDKHVDWVIVGGESGPGRRDCGVAAIVDVARQCVEGCLPVFVKQDCAQKPGQKGRIPDRVWDLKQFPNDR